jgi:addiction module HigA family antidote
MAQQGIKLGMKPSHPGAFIRTEILDELGLSVSKAAEILRVRRATLSDLLNEKSSLTPEMALRMEKAFRLNMDMLLKLQAWHDATEMRKRAGTIKVAPYVAA